MNKITREEFGMLSWAELWDRFNSLQSELEAMEGWKGQGGMTEEDTKFLHWVADRFVFVYGESENVDFVHKVREIAGPLPPKVTRERTREEKIEKLAGWIDWGYEVDSTLNGRSLALAKCSDSTLDDLCTAAGIPTTTEEV